MPFPLLSDPEADVHKKYGAWGEKISYGKKTEGVLRSIFIIGPDGRLLKSFIGVSANGSAAKALKGLAEE